jgi:predicted dienelactone hydrolase
MRTKTVLSLGVAALAIAAPATASAAQNGPAPTAANVVASTGPYSVTRTGLTNAQTPSDFGIANVWYPTPSLYPGQTFGGVAIAPGFTESESDISWLGPLLASRGFVVITFSTNSLIEAPSSRGIALNAAVKYLATSSIAKSEVDPSRLAVVGHSMGGGGVLDAELTNPSLKAGVALMPWETSAHFTTDTVPTAIVGGTSDIIAPEGSYSTPYYNSIPSTTPKAYLSLANATHFAAVRTPNPWIGAFTVEWLKRYLDGDTRYTSALTSTVPLGIAPGSVASYTATTNLF